MPNEFDIFDNPFNDGDEQANKAFAEMFINTLTGALAQQPCSEIRDWIKNGVRLAFIAKHTDAVDSDIKDIMHEGPERAEEIVKEYQTKDLASRADMEAFIEKQMKEIDALALEGRDVSIKPSLTNPLGFVYNLSDIGSYMRVFSRWLSAYVKAEE